MLGFMIKILMGRMFVKVGIVNVFEKTDSNLFGEVVGVSIFFLCKLLYKVWCKNPAIELPRSELFQYPRSLLFPFLFRDPHVFLVCHLCGR